MSTAFAPVMTMQMAFHSKRVNLELLRSLLAAATARTFGEAARQRGISTPAMSQQIRTLETQLGLQLFARVGRHAILTEDGAELVAAVRQQLIPLDDAVAAFMENGDSVRGWVQVGSPGAFGAGWLRPRLAKLLRTHPHLRLTLRYDAPAALTRQVIEGSLDIAIVVQEPDSGSLESRLVQMDEFVPVASAAYVRKHGIPTSADDFRNCPFIVYDDDHAVLRRWWHGSFGPREPMPANFVCRLTSPEDLLHFVLQGMGVSLLPEYLVAGDSAGHLVRLGQPAPADGNKNEIRIPVHLCWRRGAVLTARFRVVRDALLYATSLTNR